MTSTSTGYRRKASVCGLQRGASAHEAFFGLGPSLIPVDQIMPGFIFCLATVSLEITWATSAKLTSAMQKASN